MRELVIIRHGKSSWKSHGQEDFDRPLNERGLADIEYMAEALGGIFPKPDAVLASAALRVRQTVEGLGARLSWSEEAISFEDGLYLAQSEEILELLHRKGRGACVYLCGHNPGISELVAGLCSMDMVDLPTLSAVHIAFPQPPDADGFDWPHIDWGDGRLQNLYTPKGRVNIDQIGRGGRGE